MKSKREQERTEAKGQGWGMLTDLTTELEDGGDDHGHVAAFKEVSCGEEAVGGHTVQLHCLQEHLDVLHLKTTKYN